MTTSVRVAGVALVTAAALVLTACTGSPAGSSEPAAAGSAAGESGASGAASGGPSATPSSVPTRPATAPVPPPIRAAALPSVPARAAAATATTMTTGTPLQRTAATVAALAASGVPVVGTDGRPLPRTGSDPLGMPWTHVAGVGITNPVFSITLTDAVRLLDVARDPIPPSDPTSADELLDALRANLRSRDPQVRYFSELIGAASVRLGGAPVLDRAATAAQVRLDMATLEVFVGRIARLALVDALLLSKGRAVGGGGGGGRGTSVSVPGIGAPPLAAPPPNCADDGLNGWGVWIASKALGGVDLSTLAGEGAKWGGVSEWVVEKAIAGGEKLAVNAAKVKGAVKFLGEFAGWMTGSLSVLNFLFELAMLRATVVMQDGEPLVRNKKISEGDGEAKTLVATIEMRMPESMRGGSDPQADADALGVLNCLLALGTIVGNNTFMPGEGPVSGLRVETVGATGFNSWPWSTGSIVLFGPSTFSPQQDTDASGQITIPVQGRQQERDYPDNARPVKKKFGIVLNSTLEPPDGSAAGKTFLDSLICLGAPGFGCADAVTDILKTWQYSLGEHTFPVRDWSAGWKIDQTTRVQGGTITWKGVSCGSEKGPWQLTFTLQGSGITGRGRESMTFPGDPDEPTTGPVTTQARYTWTFEGGGGTGSGRGTDDATLVPKGDAYAIRLESAGFSTTGQYGGLSATGSGTGDGSVVLDVKEAGAADCPAL